jgi:type 1 fimbriae regulatory protein FimE
MTVSILVVDDETACGYKLAIDGQDTRAVQHYLGHKNIQHTVRYTQLSPERFKSFWDA